MIFDSNNNGAQIDPASEEGMIYKELNDLINKKYLDFIIDQDNLYLKTVEGEILHYII